MRAKPTAGPDRAADAFARASWDFPESPSARELHPYPARFIPEIPAQALDVLSVRGPVIDPFCGSGTTLAEAMRRGLPATGVDLNPIACLISRVRTSRWQAQDGAECLHHAHRLREHALEGGDTTGLEERIPRIDHWFTPPVQAALAGAVRYLDHVADPWRDRVSLAISSAVVRLSRQESDTRYAAIDQDVTQPDSATALGQAVVRTGDWLAQNTLAYGDACADVRCQDSRDLTSLPTEFFAAAIFSPPYPNAYEYWLYHKYRMYWLGFDPLLVRSAELGARPHYCRPNGLTEHDFARQMTDVFAGLQHALCDGAPAVVIIGDSVIGGRRIDNGRLIEDVATTQGFRLAARCSRAIRRGRSSFNRAHSRGRDTEHVLLLIRS